MTEDSTKHLRNDTTHYYGDGCQPPHEEFKSVLADGFDNGPMAKGYVPPSAALFPPVTQDLEFEEGELHNPTPPWIVQEQEKDQAAAPFVSRENLSKALRRIAELNEENEQLRDLANNYLAQIDRLARTQIGEPQLLEASPGSRMTRNDNHRAQAMDVALELVKMHHGTHDQKVKDLEVTFQKVYQLLSGEDKGAA